MKSKPCKIHKNGCTCDRNVAIKTSKIVNINIDNRRKLLDSLEELPRVIVCVETERNYGETHVCVKLSEVMKLIRRYL